MTHSLPANPFHTAALRLSDAPSVRAEGEGRVHGKVILIGEHAVVYGQPAIALPVNSVEAAVTLRLFDTARIDSDLYVGLADIAPEEVAPVLAAVDAVTEAAGFKKGQVGVTIRSTVPVGRGLGSSAAVAGAIVDAASNVSGLNWSLDERYELIQAAERVAHGTPSGLDARTVISDQPVYFERGKASDIRVGAPFGFVIADTGRPSYTAQALAGVRALHEIDHDMAAGAIERLGELTGASRIALAKGDAPTLGTIMTEAHGLLTRIDVSSVELNDLVTAALNAGAMGAKMTGGGLGGCILALAATPQETDALASALRAAGAADVWTMTLEATR
ncbi:mevalonate kinase [Gulosibacter molinativorax]|uniref:mevalonate kinase n=1 Tax=Gulosibacter molinativorax TaxID=256821 RepID=A0ABT7CA45_9MICO|nr:mevalonate kinase [Gulosibacter molinativorax]MDJ1371669.1 mevalonate kinase [Gulosibacter molinativorax]QUY63091.1 Mevalonate kinase [Gulosibacter molinativorax]